MYFDRTHRQELADLLNEKAKMENTMRLDEVQAFICAMISGPDCYDLSVWLPEIVGDMQLYSMQESQRILELVLILEADLKTQLMTGLAPEFILYENENHQIDYFTWCNAYLCALEYTETDWLEDEGFEDLLYPIAVLGGVYDENEDSESIIDFSADELKQLIDELPRAIVAIFTYWQDKINCDLVRTE